MSLSNFPKIVTNGLVFYYDMSNRKKSWIGAPTTNLLVSQSLGYSLYAYVTGPVVTPTSDQNNVSVTAQRYTVSTVVNAARAAFYPSSLTTGVNYVFSCYIRYNGNNVVTPSLYADASKGSPEGGANNNTFNSSSVTATPVGNNWYYLVYKFNYATCPTNRCVLAFGVNTGSDTTYLNNTYDVYNAQLEVGTLATPYANGVRSNTQSVLDLTNNYTLTGNNIVYNANDTFSFNNSYFDLNSANIITANNPFTVESWYTTTGTTSDEIFGNYGSAASSGTLWISGRYGTYISGAVYFPGAPIGAGTYHLMTTRNGAGNVILYLNGNQVNAGVLASSIPVGFNFRIGADVNGAAEPFTGSIYSVRVYNRVLSAKEVKQNFDALRGRYGL
jgi:hypothetical protein